MANPTHIWKPDMYEKQGGLSKIQDIPLLVSLTKATELTVASSSPKVFMMKFYLNSKYLNSNTDVPIHVEFQ